MREALLVQQFLDGHSSQLTYHGLVALQEGLRPNQLAVFFRCGGGNAGWCWGGEMHGVLQQHICFAPVGATWPPAASRTAHPLPCCGG